MDQARTTISKIFNGEPRSYTRFSLTQNMEGGDSQVEMKLAPEVEEEVGTNGVGEHLNHQSQSPYRRKPSRTPKNIFYLIAVTLLIFIIGYLIGYLVHRKQDKSSPTCDQTDDQAVAGRVADDEDSSWTGSYTPQLDWSDVKKLFGDKLTVSQIEASLREFASNDHRAGSPGDEDLANKVLQRFRENNLKTWDDKHYVTLQVPPTSASNSLTFRGQNLGPLQGYLAYSASGSAEGSVLYAYYGRVEDFEDLEDNGVGVSGRIVLVRAGGRISFAEKVANAANMNASAVLIYPDPADYAFSEGTHLFGHVHLGSGDPYTPGFPSFNHTQFPPARSSGLPNIIAQTITASMAKSIMGKMGGRTAPRSWIDGGLSGVLYKLGEDSDTATVQVNNALANTRIHNVFGVIKGVTDPDRYVVIGAQRDAWGPGFAKSTVGTALLVELAKTISYMVREGRFVPRRSFVFASWTAGEYGNIGATEWLESYLPSLSMKAYSYISLDGVVAGTTETFKASASPLMNGLILDTMKEVYTVHDPRKTIFAQVGEPKWEGVVLEDMDMSNPAYPFTTFSGIPSVSFRFSAGQAKGVYPFYNTLLDTRENLNSATYGNVAKVARAAGQVAGHMALRLVHDHLIRLSVEQYDQIIRKRVIQINGKVNVLLQNGRLPANFTPQWLISAMGSYGRGARSIYSAIENSDLEDTEHCRLLNDRLMRVEANLLSPYVSPIDSPFRHILLGSGQHTLSALVENLDALKSTSEPGDVDRLLNQFAQATWTIQSCANALAGEVWDMDNNI
ncbi:transferrin receptor 1a [Sardina pilchardus]|uniref:transferrin receptor 1a n=1 Tax=Sardina pilchardus TaxID=27697 RepID=UPI002E126ECD